MEDHNVPTPLELREKIQNISKTKIRTALQFQYVTGTRISEVCGKYRLIGKHFETTTWNDTYSTRKEPALLFHVFSKTMPNIPRIVAIPLDPTYEPWIETILMYCLNRSMKNKTMPIFKVTPRTIQNYCKEYFKGLEYYIEEYTVGKTKVPGHFKPLSTHGIRHIRATQLINEYLFDGIDITIFCGWRITRELAMPQMAKRYVYGQWGRYFPKLLKPFKGHITHGQEDPSSHVPSIEAS